MGGILVLFATLLCSVCLSVVQGIELAGLSTLKPTISATTLAWSIYRINATTGTTCILIQTDALLSITYLHKLDGDVEAHLYLPHYPELSGDCSDPDSESLTMSFKGFTINMYFKKTPDGEHWYISNIELTFSTSNPIFKYIDVPNLNVSLTTQPRIPMLFPTPVGKSYCNHEEEVMMYPTDYEYDTIHMAKLYLRDLRMQCFMYKSSGKWGPPFQGRIIGTYRDETVPLVVGTTLAVAVLVAISGYGIWRYIKVKKLQYGTMELH